MERNLQEKVAEAKTEFELNPSPENKNNLEQVKDDLESFIERKVQGNLIRARVEQIEEGEKSTQQFFLAMEKQNHVRKHMKKVVSGNRITEDPDEILQFKEECDKKISLKELTDTLSTFDTKRSPGNDGLQANFFARFWDILGPKFEQVILSEGQLSHSQKQGVITLIDKRNKDRSFLESWKPITLLNTDYKLISSKVLATRMKKVLPSIIKEDQAGYVKDRYIR